ncbi:hypothetical protein AH0328V1_2504 [Enterobacter cloacae]|nr:hypothetical protein AH0328V1_2504 [Enterobacter cloacae]CAH3302769.1 hypothetical protein AH0328V1_2504 [Enterobacter cloacae]
MRNLVLMLALSVFTYTVQAADWLSWRKVGDATLTWGPFTVYTSQLLTPDGSYTGLDGDNALIITYARDIDGDDLVEATRDQWQAQGILQQEPQSEAWLRMLKALWPDVTPARSSRLWLITARDNSGIAPRRRRKNLRHSGHARRQRLAHAFWRYGSIPAPNILNCVSS